MTANLQDLAWDDVRLFLAAARARGLGAAARRLGVDTSTVSRRLAALEAALGVRLFERTRDGLTATRAGEVALPAAEAMESAQARLVRDTSGIETAVEGVVRLSAAPGLAQDLVAPSLVRLRARHPRLRIELDASTRPIDLGRHEADLALRSTRLQGADLLATKLATSRWIAMAVPGLAAALGRVARWEALPWIGWDGAMASFHVARWLVRAVPDADVVLRTSDFPSQLAAARSGLGVVMAPEVHAATHGLVAVTFTRRLAKSAAEWPEDDLWLVGHRALRATARVAAVWDFLAAELRPPIPRR